MSKEDIEVCERISKKIISNVEEKLKNHIGNQESGKFVKIGADGTPTQYIDLVAEKEVIDVLKNTEFSSFLISEEVGELRIGKGIHAHINISETLLSTEKVDEKFIFIVDPLDGTNNAIKKIPAYGISIAVANVPKNGKLATLEDVELGFIKNFENGDFYEAIKKQGAKLNGKPMTPSNETKLSKVSLGGYISNPSFNAFNLIKKIKIIRLLGSVVLELAYIANGKYDIFMDLRGSRIIDIAASKLVIEESNGIITNPFGRELKSSLNINEKALVIASNSNELHEKVIKAINKDMDQLITSIGVVSRLDNKESILFAGKLIQNLLKIGIDVSIEDSLAIELEKLKNCDKLEEIIEKIKNKKQDVFNEINNLELKVDFDKLGTPIEKFQTDMIITLGGDGTLLRAQNQVNNKEIPIFGINMGTVGFLTETDVEYAFEAIETILRGDYYKEKRTQIIASHEDQMFTALNEVVIMTEKPAKMLNFEIHVDGEIVEEFRADGLILSTPSGSTAYSMSAGGPIVDPKVGAFIIIPICPYKLSFRPFVVSDESEIRVKLLKKGKKAVFVMDGQISKKMNYLEEIIFKKSKNDVYFIRTNKNEFYQKVKEKLTES